MNSNFIKNFNYDHFFENLKNDFKKLKKNNNFHIIYEICKFQLPFIKLNSNRIEKLINFNFINPLNFNQMNCLSKSNNSLKFLLCSFLSSMVEKYYTLHSKSFKSTFKVLNDDNIFTDIFVFEDDHLLLSLIVEEYFIYTNKNTNLIHKAKFVNSLEFILNILFKIP